MRVHGVSVDSPPDVPLGEIGAPGVCWWSPGFFLTVKADCPKFFPDDSPDEGYLGFTWTVPRMFLEGEWGVFRLVPGCSHTGKAECLGFPLMFPRMFSYGEAGHCRYRGT